MSKKEDEILMIYQVTVDDIRYSKTQQWLILFYSLLLIAGVFSLISTIYGSFSCILITHKIFFTVILALIPIIAGLIYYNYICDQNKYRKRIRKVRNTFEEESKNILGELPKKYGKSSYFLKLHILFGLIVFLASIIIITLLWL
jgi:hypothetical protein